jgi:hypothetical protein
LLFGFFFLIIISRCLVGVKSIIQYKNAPLFQQ